MTPRIDESPKYFRNRRNAANREYRAKHRAARALADRLYRVRNRAERIAYDRQWYALNREYKLAMARAYRAANRDWQAEKAQAYRAANREFVNLMARDRRSERNALARWLVLMVAHAQLRERRANLRLDDHFMLMHAVPPSLTPHFIFD